MRRRCKALRGLVRLVRPAFPGFELENAAFRDIARALSGTRDSSVLADTLDALTADADADAAGDPGAVARLREQLAGRSGAAGAVPETTDQCAERLLAARVRAATWYVTAEGWDALIPGFVRTFKAARHWMAAFAAVPDPHRAHEWRKQVKYHWHHLRLLRAAAPEPIGRRVRLAARLGDLLGDRHDLDMLVAALATRPDPDSDHAAADDLTARAQQRAALLDRQALRLGERLFDAKPRRLIAGWRDKGNGLFE